MLKGLPSPRPDYDTKPFWDGCKEGRFLVPRCSDCSTVRWPPGPMCPNCQSESTEWIESTGRGTVYSWVVAHHPVHPALVDQVPYVIALIELPEGVRVVGNVTGCDPDEIEPDMPVELFFEDAEEGLRLPNFRLV